jgi:hypothetical protein
VVSRRTWRLADLGAKHALLREGIGWGNMNEFPTKKNRELNRAIRDYASAEQVSP